MAKLRSRAKVRKTKAKKSTAKKRPASAKPPGNATPVKELERLARLSDVCRDRSKKATGQIGGEIKAAVENKHLNAKAFKAVLAERRMGLDDPIKLRDFMDACGYYRDALKVGDLKAPDMMATGQSSTKSARKRPVTSTGPMKPIGEAAGNVVSLAGAMQDAIAKDKPKAEMEVA